MKSRFQSLRNPSSEPVTQKASLTNMLFTQIPIDDVTGLMLVLEEDGGTAGILGGIDQLIDLDH